MVMARAWESLDDGFVDFARSGAVVGHTQAGLSCRHESVTIVMS
jgi:hypothetical protein